MTSPAPALLLINAAKRYRNVANATALIWKVLMAAEERFRRLTAPHLLEEVYQGMKYVDGKRREGSKSEGRRLNRIYTPFDLTPAKD